MLTGDLAVVTPTTCQDIRILGWCIGSVRCALAALLKDLDIPGRHYIVIDDDAEGRDNAQLESVRKIAESHGATVVCLPHATGKGGWNGHRIYAAMGWLVPQTYIAYLDEDNTVLPCHYTGLFRALNTSGGARWAHSLRTIVGPDGQTCHDNCESLGLVCHSVLSPDDTLVDTSCYVLETRLARDLSGAWNARARDPERTEVDRALASALVTSFRGAVSRTHSVMYRAGSRSDSVKLDFFKRGNSVWDHDFTEKPDLYVFWMHPRVSNVVVSAIASMQGTHSMAFEEWNANQLRDLKKHFNVIDGYANATGHRRLPCGAKVLVGLCFQQSIEALGGVLAEDDRQYDILVYTAESPNYRHRHQWTKAWLALHFGPSFKMLTYYQPFLTATWCRAQFVPHNCHHFTDDDFMNPALLATPRAITDRSVVMVLEPRPGSQIYWIDETRLLQLDHKRATFMRGMRATVVGRGWNGVAAADPVGSKEWTVIDVTNRQLDKPAFEYYATHQFAVIVENTSAPGYVSEKLYDALAAGCIPLYYNKGNMDTPEMQFLRESGVFIDISECSLGSDVARLIEGLSDTDIADLQQRILLNRVRILQRVGASAFSQSVCKFFFVGV